MRRPEIVKRIQEILRRVAPGTKAILFGSEARGEARPDSDIDLLILLDKDHITLEEERAITYPLYEMEYDTGVLVNPVVLTKKLWETVHHITPFYHNVLKEGIVL